MKGFYLVCFLLSFSLFLWQSVSDARQSVVQRTALLIVIISNGGYLALAGASNLTEAVLATKILYVAACFLPMLYFITVCEVCRVCISRFLLAVMCSLQIALYGTVCAIGHNNLFYRNIVFHADEQVVYLTKDYGPFHLLYLISMYLYYLLTLMVAAHGKRSGFVVELRDETEHEPLWEWVGKQTAKNLTLTFAEIQQILGFPIDHSFLNDKKELLAYGYRVGKISMKKQTVDFQKTSDLRD